MAVIFSSKAFKWFYFRRYLAGYRHMFIRTTGLQFPLFILHYYRFP